MTSDLKLPSTCRCCGARLSAEDMRLYLEGCQRDNVDPMAALTLKPPGIACLTCNLRCAQDLTEENPDSAVGKAYRKLVHHARADHLGLTVIQGGKKGKRS